MQVRRPGRGGVSRRVSVFSQPLRAAFPTNAKTEKYEFYKFESAFAAANVSGEEIDRY